MSTPSTANAPEPRRVAATSRPQYKKLPPSQQSAVTRLQPEQRAQLVQWLESGTTYAEAVQRLRAEFNHSTNISSLCRWWTAQIKAEPDQSGSLLDVIVDVGGTPLRIQVSRPKREAA